jgi:dipeptidyl aminopeptidase/acylaminoacyl peptidase
VGRHRSEEPDGTSNYDSQANQNFAKNLKGHLLLAHGTMDDNVPPNNTCWWSMRSSRPTRTSTCC